MFCLSDSDRFFLYPYPTDMRKSFYSLSGIVTEKMGKDVQEGDAFIFINKSLTNMKILHAEYGGLVIYNMRLESGTFRLSDIDCEDSSASLSINWSELTLIVHGISPSETKRAPHVRLSGSRKSPDGAPSLQGKSASEVQVHFCSPF